MYHINDVVGPDEYKEHADDNAYTNYMAHWNLGIAITYYEDLKEHHIDIFERLNAKMGLDAACRIWRERRPLIYLPQPRKEDVYKRQPIWRRRRRVTPLCGSTL